MGVLHRWGLCPRPALGSEETLEVGIVLLLQRYEFRSSWIRFPPFWGFPGVHIVAISNRVSHVTTRAPLGFVGVCFGRATIGARFGGVTSSSLRDCSTMGRIITVLHGCTLISGSAPFCSTRVSRFRMLGIPLHALGSLAAFSEKC